MITSAWNNGKHHQSGAGYGLKVSSEDRYKYFDKDWSKVSVEIPFRDEIIEADVNIDKKSFWDSNCGELIKIEIGTWLISQGYRRWEKGNPPKIELTPLGDCRFRINGIISV
jgi:hypothetical protein